MENQTNQRAPSAHSLDDTDALWPEAENRLMEAAISMPAGHPLRPVLIDGAQCIVRLRELWGEVHAANARVAALESALREAAVLNPLSKSLRDAVAALGRRS